MAPEEGTVESPTPAGAPATAAENAGATMEGRDAEDALLDKPKGPSGLDTLARTDSIAGKPRPTPASTGTPAGKVDTPAAASLLSDDMRQQLAQARLRPIPNETNEQASARLINHYSSRSSANWQELQTMRSTVEGLRSLMEPMLRTFYRNQEMAQREAVMSQIPDKESDPQGYAIWLGEQNLRIQAERDRAAQEYALQGQTLAEENARLEEILSQDEEVIEYLGAAIEADPATAESYDLLTGMMIDQTRVNYPDASDEEVNEFVQLAQTLEMRAMRANGLDIPSTIRAKADATRKMMARFGVGGNGHPQPAPAHTPPTIVSPTAARLERESSQAQARASVIPNGPSAAPSGAGGYQLRGMSEDDFVDLALDGKITDQMLIDTFGQNSRWPNRG